MIHANRETAATPRAILRNTTSESPTGLRMAHCQSSPSFLGEGSTLLARYYYHSESLTILVEEEETKM